MSILIVFALAYCGLVQGNDLLAAPGIPRERPVKVVPARRPPATQVPAKKRRVRPKPPLKPYVPPELPERQRIGTEELVQLANDYEIHIEQISQQIKALLADAKKIGDPIRLNCLLDKFFQIQNLRAVASRAMSRLDASVAERDDDAVFRHYNALSTAHQGVMYFAEQASSCSSSPNFQVTTQAIESSAPAANDKTEGSAQPSFPLPVYPVPDRPAYASPYI